MNSQILINTTPQETRTCIIEHGAVQEVHIERTSELDIVGNIYWGKVTRVLPGMQAAFVDIGVNRTGFLHVSDIHTDAQTASNNLAIERLLYPGQNLMVQVAKDSIGGKGARLTAKISIAGRFFVFLPNETGLGISQKIQLEHERNFLKNKIHTLLKEFPEIQNAGFIVRTEANHAKREELKHDVFYLEATWKKIRNSSVQESKLIHRDIRLAERMLRDYVTAEVKSIQIDSSEQFSNLKLFSDTYMPDVSSRLVHYTGERPIFDLFSIEDEINKAIQSRVDLKSGGYLIIDPTEAMTTIDVNTGAFISGKNLADTVYKTNLEATHAIARQLRLRNLGGIIVVDFIDMEQADHKQHVLNELRAVLKNDRSKNSVSDFSNAGIIEITRKRIRESLNHLMCTNCPTCLGRGSIKNVKTICYEILRELVRESRQFNPIGFRVVAAPRIVEALIEEEAMYLSKLIDFIGKNVSLHSENSYTLEHYDIILV